MSFRSNNSTFDPLDYYKKLTLCLANKKNLKINISRVPGGKEYVENKRLPGKITDAQLQAKFLAKYNERKQQELQKAKNEEQSAVPVTVVKQNPFNFNVKQHGVLGGKRKNTDEDSCVNLPDSYFKDSKNVPDLSIFKVPEIPAHKKLRTEEASNESKSIGNFSLDSLFAGNFKPPRTSTPLEIIPIENNNSTEPIISDPSDILEFKLTNTSKLTTFLKTVNETALKICKRFSNIKDPISNITQKLTKKEAPKISSRPIPEFFHQPSAKVHDDDQSSKISVNNFTKEISTNVSCASEYFDGSNDDITFTTSPIHSLLTQASKNTIDSVFLITSPTPNIPCSNHITPSMSFNWFEDIFAESCDDDDIFEFPQEKANLDIDMNFSLLENSFSNSTENIFKIPPDSPNFKRKRVEGNNLMWLFSQSKDEDNDDDIFKSPPRPSNLRKKFSQVILQTHGYNEDDLIWKTKDDDHFFDATFDLF